MSLLMNNLWGLRTLPLGGNRAKDDINLKSTIGGWWQKKKIFLYLEYILQKNDVFLEKI